MWKLTQTVSGYNANVLHYAALSGSIEAMEYAIKTLGIDKYSTDANGKSILHYAAQSGAIEAMRYVIDVLGMNAGDINNSGVNVLHYAVLSGSVKAIEYVINTLEIDLGSTTNNGANALHWAAKSGSMKAVRFIRKLSHDRNLQLNVCDFRGLSAFWYADHSNNASLIKRVLAMPFEELMLETSIEEIKPSEDCLVM
ncbi:ankyrin repeat domain-containing protein [Coxiella burnetii]|uniref:ankyrin repeat domain-containing protein n=2 Tax=Coxiella burnetii TaxID=777 RepID=UPI001E2AFAFA|nr:ankyrin repeat domain-containing protein [Coxiella burnetii]UYK70040.1 ankyrin repeat domain-containing protein [Coxiella burnetii]